MDKRTKAERAELKKHTDKLEIERLDRETKLYKAEAKRLKAKSKLKATKRRQTKKARVLPKLTKRDRYGYRWL